VKTNNLYFNKAEKNYKIYNKEMLVIIRCLETWIYFLKKAKSITIKSWNKKRNLILN